MSETNPGTEDDHNFTLDATDDDWEWRRKIRSNPHSHLIYRIIVGVLGLVIVVFGLILVPFPGPGWLIVFLGLAIWASEFEWAQRLLRIAKHTVREWTERIRFQPWWVKGLAGLGCAVAVAAVIWFMFLISGVPGFFPDGLEEWLKGAEHHPGSWWNDWQAWMDKQNAGEAKVPARTPGDGKLKVLEDAPGSYAMLRLK